MAVTIKRHVGEKKRLLHGNLCSAEKQGLVRESKSFKITKLEKAGVSIVCTGPTQIANCIFGITVFIRAI